MLVVILAYILGAIPGGYLINRYLRQIHLRVTDSRLLPKKSRRFIGQHGPAGYSILADLLKGALVVWLVPYVVGGIATGNWRWLAYPFVSPGLVQVAALIAGVLGHVFSVYVCGWGGKGVATAFGGFLVLTPSAALCAMSVFVVAAFVRRAVWIAALAASWVLPVFVWYFYRLDALYQITAVVLAVLTLVTHYHDLQRQAERRGK